MIKTATQIKALVRNMTNGDSVKAQIILGNYARERFLERLSLSNYCDKFIIKGVLISSLVGQEKRATMDIDGTLKKMSLNIDDVKTLINNILEIKLDDSMKFDVISIDQIMDESEYYGIRVRIMSYLDKMRIPIKIDFSTGDIITPGEVDFVYGKLFNQGTINLKAYPLETILAEKLETILVRSSENTRMRDFYDLVILYNLCFDKINCETLKAAVDNTLRQRQTIQNLEKVDEIFKVISNSKYLMELWNNYRNKFDYASQIEWKEVLIILRKWFEIIDENNF